VTGARHCLTSLALSLLLGCLSAERTRHAYFLAPGQEGAPGAQRWLLVPTSALSPVPDHLQAPTERLDGEILARLEQAGRAVTPVALSEVVRTGARLASGATPSKGEELQSRLARELAASREVDVVAFPDLMSDEIRVQQGGFAAWDGVKRRQRLVRREGAPEVYAFGSNHGLSLRMRVFGRDGVKRFESRGGLDLVYEARIVGMRYTLEPRSDLLVEPEVLRAGVDLALHPYLPVRPPVESDDAEP
jgi:hypothetical protein